MLSLAVTDPEEKVNRPFLPEAQKQGYWVMEKNNCGNRNSPEVRDRAVWVVFEHQDEFDSQSAVIKSAAPKIGSGTDTFRAWV